jgi:hypothetical protein
MFNIDYSKRAKRFLKKADKILDKQVIGIIKIDKRERVY